MHKSTTALRRGLRSSARVYSTAIPPTTQVTTLPNGIRVATENSAGHFSALGLYVDAGSRYETPLSSGTSHFLDRMAFKTTTSRSEEDMSSTIDSLGGQILASSSRETIMYQSCHFQSKTPLAMSIIADSVLNPAFLPEEIDLQRDAARYEIREISSKPEMIIPEILHDVAYSGRTLGNPLLCPEDRIDMVDENTIRLFMREMYRPERIVIAGAGMQHQELVELADKHFSSLKSPATPLPEHNFSSASRTGPAQPQIPSHLLSPQSPSIMKSLTRAASYLSGSTSVDSPSALNAMAASGKAVYTGGHRFIHQPDLEFNHLYLGFEGVDIHDNDIYALATMQILLGGGGSFSAGGPGKGMYSRLYTHILNHYPQIDHCASFHHIYADSSLFGLFASFFPAVAGKGHGHSQNAGNSPAQIFPHLVHQLSLLLYSPLNSQELSRAKNQLKSSLVMALESRAVEVEDLGRQLLVHNRKIPVAEMCDRIDEVDADSIRRVANRLFGPDSKSRATVVVQGHEDVGDYKPVLRKYGVSWQ